MRQDEERTTEHHHTPSIKARQPGRRKSNQIPRGRDQHKHWARTPQGTNHRGGGRQQETGEESQQQPRKGQTQRSPTTPREAHKGQRKRHPQKRRQKHKHNKPHHKQEPGTIGKETRNQGQTNGKESTAHTKNTQTNDQTTKRGGARRGTGPQKGRKKTPTTK